MTWRIDAASLPDHLDRLNPRVPSTTRMPAKLEVILLTDFSYAPVDWANFAKSTVDNLWSSFDDDEVKLPGFSQMSLELIVNGIEDMPYKYVLRAPTGGGLPTSTTPRASVRKGLVPWRKPVSKQPRFAASSKETSNG